MVIRHRGTICASRNGFAILEAPFKQLLPTWRRTLFWPLAALLAVLAALALSLPFWTGRRGAASRASHDVEAYRAQLREVKQDVSRGVLTEAEAESARIELSRRLLAAADAAEVETGAAPTPRGLVPLLAGVAAIGVPLLAFGVYFSIGSPALPDQPLASRSVTPDRPSQEQAEALAAENNAIPAPAPVQPVEGMPALPDLIAQLEAKLKERPDDARGLELLARTTARVGRYTDSWRAYGRLIVLDPEAAPADLYAGMAEAMVMATGGYVSPEAEEAVDIALEKDSTAARARHFKALALAQRGETEAALDRWVALLKDAPTDAPWRELVAERARQSADELGVDLPETLVPPGPTAAQRAAAEEMLPEDRQAMIEGMVTGLAERLKDDPDDLEGWLRLIRAYRVMGRPDDARAAQTTALETFAENADATRQLKAALQ